MKRQFLVIEEVAELLRRPRRQVRDLAGRASIPHRRVTGQRPLLFVEAELEEWLDGAELEVLETSDGGRVVRPIAQNGRAS